MTFEIETVETYGMTTALRALRRPMNRAPLGHTEPDENDMRLILSLVRKGDDHAKFARLIGVGFTIRAPRYWWIEFATYRHGIESVSESTMHRKISEPFVPVDFEDGEQTRWVEYARRLNELRDAYPSGAIELYEMKAEIPESYLQTRDITASYQALRHIYKASEGHKLPHWEVFRKWIEKLPYSKIITV